METFNKILPFAMCLLVSVLLMAGVLVDPWRDVFVSALFVGIVIFSALRVAYLGNRFARREDTDSPFLDALEVGFWAISIAYLLIYASQGLASPLYPILYLLIALLAALNAPAVMGLVLLYALLLEFAIPFFNNILQGSYKSAMTHAGLMILFAAVNNLLLRVYLQVQRSHTRVELVKTLDRIEEEARNFRFFKNSDSPMEEHRRQQDVATFFEIHSILQDQLKLLWATMHAYTCSVLWINEDRESLKVTAVYPPNRSVVDSNIDAAGTIFQGVLKQGVPLRVLVSESKKNYPAYYRLKEDIYTMCVVPIKDGEKIRGLLIADRKQQLEFSEAELKVMEITAGVILKSMVNENLLRDLDSSQHEYMHLAEASKEIARTLEIDEVLRVSLEATHKIANFDLGAIVMQKPDNGEYEVVASVPEELGLTGTGFQMGGTLVDWVVRKNQLLVNQDFDRLPKRPIIFTPGEKLRDVGSLLILPLNAKGNTRGAFVLISGQQRFFSEELQRIFQIITNQIAVSMENAEIYKEKEQMAITDSLTGLYNRRFFKERMEEMVSRAGRYQKKLGVMMFDIDHFKNINDTYGHPVGDIVLKKVAKILIESMRKTDLVARYGGEEFIVVLDDADPAFAKHKCEEIREEMSALSIETNIGSFSLTASAGISIFPDDGNQDIELVEKADEALYHSKRNGRNQSTLHYELK